MRVEDYDINPTLIVIDMQNGFVSKGGSYDLLGMDVIPYQQIIPKIRHLIMCRSANIPIFYTQAIREPSGIDLLTHTHRILPKSREERIKKKPICVRGIWDAEIIDDLAPDERNDHVIIKRRDSAFHNTEIEVWLRSVGVDTLFFCGVDTSIRVEASLRDAFNIGYDVVLISDATASSNKKHYESTIEHVKEYYGLVMSIDGLSKFLTRQPQTIIEQTEDTDNEIMLLLVSKSVQCEIFLFDANVVSILSRF